MEILDAHLSRREYLAIAGAAFVTLPSAANGQEGESKVPEYAVKAALLYKFFRFLTWPEDPSSDEATGFAIGLLGKDPFGSTLDDTVAGKTVQNRAIEIVRSEKLEDLLECPVIFICSSESAQLDAILKDTRNSAILTVGDTEGFAEKGVMMNLVLRDKKVKFQVNYAAMREAGIDVDAQLLRLAELVGPAGEKKESDRGQL